MQSASAKNVITMPFVISAQLNKHSVNDNGTSLGASVLVSSFTILYPSNTFHFLLPERIFQASEVPGCF